MNFTKANFSFSTIKVIANVLYGLSEPIMISKLGGIPNDNYLVISGTDKIVIKVYSKGQSDLMHIKKEIQFVPKFEAKGIIVPHFISGIDDQILQTYNGFYITATKFIEGIPLTKLKFTGQLLFDVGVLTGKVLEVGKNLDITDIESRTCVDELDYLLSNVDHYNTTNGYHYDIHGEFNVDECYQIALWFDEIEKQFLHRDIWKHNLIQTPNGLALLDFNDWSIGSSCFEICVPILVFSIPDINGYRDDLLHSFLEGFRSISSIHYDTEEVIDGLKFICFLYFLYNMIQSNDRYDSEIYIFRNRILQDPTIIKTIKSTLSIIN